ncbi:MAG: sugar ABC transporter permease [Acidobacteria bacterium]|nr:sugar ABC transporter permease [Acidobacteriota bacterium]
MAKLAAREAAWGYGFISLWLVGLLAFTAGPILAVFYWSFTDYPILSAPKWVGLANFEKIFTGDPLFWKSLANTAYYVGLRVPLHLLLAFGLALLINRTIRGISVLRTAVYLPSVVPVVALAIVWRLLLDPRSGYFNYYGGLVGIPSVNWLTSEAWIKPAIIGISLYQVGIAMVVFLAGLQAVPEQLYEAASIDGASAWQRLLSVTIPMVTPVILYNLIVDIINSFQVFAYAYILTKGGPADAALFYVLYIYRHAFELFQMGYAAALSAILFLIILAFTAVLMAFSDRWVQYERI